MWPKISCLSSLASVSSSVKKDHRTIASFKQETPCRKFSREPGRRQVNVIHIIIIGIIAAIAFILW